MRRLWIFVPVLTLTAGGLVAQPSEPREPVATSSVTGTMLVVSPKIAYTSATLRVAGPVGYEAIAWSQAGEIALDLFADGVIKTGGEEADAPMTLPDGRYSYEAVFHTPQGQRFRAGLLSVESGVATLLDHQQVGDIEEEATDVDNILRVNDTANDGDVVINLNAEDVPPAGTTWGIWNDNDDLRFRQITTNSSGGTVIDAFRMTFADDGNVGIGTTQPQAPLHIFRPGAHIRIADSSPCPNPDATWELRPDFGALNFSVVTGCAGDNAGLKMSLAGNGNVGIGSLIPGEELEIAAAFPSVRFRDSEGTAQVWDIEGNSFDFQVQDVTRGGIAPFLIRPGAGHHTLVLDPGSRVGVGTFSPSAKLHVAGNGRIDGDVALGSSRTLKTAFDAVDPAEVLARVADLPVTSWRYKTEEESKRHIGPFAEDFQRLFGLGDGETISVIDAQGVAFAAIQGLKQELAAKDAEMAERDAQLAKLRSENADLAARLAAIEEAVDR